MRFVLWRIIRALAIAAVAGAVVYVVSLIPWNVPEKHYEITEANVEVELQRDGSLLVTEHLTFDFTGDFTGAFREFPLNGDARVTDVQVSEGRDGYTPGGNTTLGSFDLPGRFGAVREVGQDFRVVWHYRASDETRTFDVAYTVVDATTVHDDVVDATWTVWGDQWDFRLDHLDASISAQSGVGADRAWLRPRALGVDPEIAAEASVSVDDVRRNEAVGLRAVFPRKAVSSTGGAERQDGDGLAGIEADEARQDDAESTLDRLANAVSGNVLAISLAIGALALLITSMLFWLCRERSTDTPEYIPEPPENIPPALAYALAEEGHYDDRVVLATLLDLVDRGFYEARADAGAKDLDLELKLADDRPERGGQLESYEVAVLDFFDKLLPKNSWLALGKMSDQIPQHSQSWKSRWDNMNEKLDSAGDDLLGWDRDLRFGRTLVAGLFILIICFIGYLEIRRTGGAVIPIITAITTVLLMYALPGTWLQRMRVGPRKRNAQWRAFEKWTRDFPRLDDDPPSTLKLWRRILVYAVAFGTAERVAKSGRIPAPVGEEATDAGGWTAYAVTSTSFGHNFGGFSSGFASQVQPESSSSGGGGGGGGGGGFSGGGGGGAW